jgi:hypothetical protein
MFCAPGLAFGGAEYIGSRFHVLRALTHFLRYRGRQVSFHVLRSRTHFRRCRWRHVPFSNYKLTESFSAVPRAGTVFMFFALGLVFGGTEGVGSRFHVLLARTQFQRYRGRGVPFSCFARPDTFSAVPRVPGFVFKFFAPRLIFGGDEFVGSRFHVLSSRTRFRRYRGSRVPFSCFVLPNSFSAVPRATSPVFMLCAPGLVFDGTEGVGSCFQVLRNRTRFRRYRGRQVPFSCFTLPDSFSAVPIASGPVFMFCFPGLVFGGVECVGSRFHVLRARTHFRRYRWRRVPFSCFALPDSFSAVPRALDPFFMFSARELVFE